MDSKCLLLLIKQLDELNSKINRLDRKIDKVNSNAQDNKIEIEALEKKLTSLELYTRRY